MRTETHLEGYASTDSGGLGISVESINNSFKEGKVPSVNAIVLILLSDSER